MALYKIFSSRVNNIDADQYAGSVVEEGLIWYDPNTGTLRLYNGSPGGQIINGSGNVGSQLVNGTSNVVVYPNGNVAISVNGTANVAVFSNPIANFGNIIATGNVTANEFIGNGAGLTDVTASQVGVLPNLSVSGTVTTGNLSATGNITGQFFIGNGALLTGIAASYGNANVADFLPTYTGNLAGDNLVVTNTVFAGQLDTQDSSELVVVPPLHALTSVAIDDALTVGGNIAATSVSAAQGQFGELNTALIDSTDSSAITVVPDIHVLAELRVDNGIQSNGIITTTALSATGNVYGNYFYGNGSQLTGIDTLPPQAGNAGKYLGTNGVAAAWENVYGAFGITFDCGNASYVAPYVINGGTA